MLEALSLPKATPSPQGQPVSSTWFIQDCEGGTKAWPPSLISERPSIELPVKLAEAL